MIDLPTLRSLLASLSDAPIAIAGAATPPEVLAELRARGVDVVVSDLGLACERAALVDLAKSDRRVLVIGPRENTLRGLLEATARAPAGLPTIDLAPPEPPMLAAFALAAAAPGGFPDMPGRRLFRAPSRRVQMATVPPPEVQAATKAKAERRRARVAERRIREAARGGWGDTGVETMLPVLRERTKAAHERMRAEAVAEREAERARLAAEWRDWSDYIDSTANTVSALPAPPVENITTTMVEFERVVDARDAAPGPTLAELQAVLRAAKSNAPATSLPTLSDALADDLLFGGVQVLAEKHLPAGSPPVRVRAGVYVISAEDYAAATGGAS